MTDPTREAEVLGQIGKKCDVCGEVIRAVEIDCRGAKERGEKPPILAACRCCHFGDFMCNCGNPCWSFF